jgi:hypothetical protein
VGGGEGTDAFSLSTLNSHSLEQRGGTGVGGGDGKRLSPHTGGSLSRGGGGVASWRHLPWPLTFIQLCNILTYITALYRSH